MPSVTRSASESQAIRDLRVVNAELQRISVPAWMKLGLPMAQLKALVALANADGVSVTGLAQTLSVGEPTTSQLVDQLVRRGYAERTPDQGDRRRVIVAVTPTGADLISELLQGRRKAVGEWLTTMSDDDVDALARGLRALALAASDGEGTTCD
jgi:MarR family transcriptional regulator, organic hydroperoxide resistance regulator